MKRAVWMAACVLALAGGCKKKSSGSKGGAGGVPGASPASDSAGKASAAAAEGLWAYAPPDAAFGLVLGDGVAARTLKAGVDFVAMLDRQPAGKMILDKARAKWPPEMPDLRDPAALAAKGIDLAKGGAVFFSGDKDPKPRLVILPVGNLAAFRTLTKATTTKDGDLDLDKFGDHQDKNPMLCAQVGPRYLCAPTADLIRAAAKPHDSALAKGVKALPATQRGDLELYLDPTAITAPDFMDTLRKAQPVLTDITAVTGMVRLGSDGLTERFWIAGKPGLKAGGFLAAPPPDSMASITKDVAGVTRLHFDPRLILVKAPPRMPVGGVDLRADLLDQLTGDVQLMTGGKSLLGMAMALGIKDADKVKGALKIVCTMVKMRAPQLDITMDGDACTVVPPPQLMMPLMMAGLGGPMKLHVAVEGKLLVAREASFDLAAHQGSAADDAGNAETREVVAGASTFSGWGRGFDMIGQMPPAMVAQLQKAPGMVMDQIQLISWLGLHLYDVGMSVGVAPDGIHALFRVNTFGGDPPDARAAYEAAVDKRMANDSDGYRAALASIEKKFGDTVAGRQAALTRVGYPPSSAMIGVMAAVAIPAFLKYQRKAISAEARFELGVITKGVRFFYEDKGELPKAKPLTPAKSCCEQGGKCGPDATAWAGWDDIKYGKEDWYEFQYQLEVSGDASNGKVVARAVGDPGCKGHPVVFEQETTIENGVLHAGQVHAAP